MVDSAILLFHVTDNIDTAMDMGHGDASTASPAESFIGYESSLFSFNYA